MTTEYTELRRLLDEATPRPWMAEGSQVWGPDGVLVAAVREHSTIVDRPDALIIAAAVNALPGLLDALDEAEAKLRRAHQIIGNLTVRINDTVVAELNTHWQGRLADAWDEGHRASERDWEMAYDLTTPDEDRQPWPNPYRRQETTK